MKKTTDNLSEELKWSLIGHVSLFIFCILKSYTFPDYRKPFSPSLKVDLVALPDLLKKDLNAPSNPSQNQFKEEISQVLKKLEQTAQSAQTLKPNQMTIASKEGFTSREQKNKQALRRLKSLARIQNWAEEPTPSPPKKLFQGNQLSTGNSLEGEAKESAESNYQDLLRDRLHENWQLPVWLLRQNLSAQVQIYIAESGDLLRYVFENPSGNVQFDSAVKKTILQSHPFPTPPSELSRRLMSRGISVRFPL
jgi:outer membrane biosynthesis protein TonB